MNLFVNGRQRRDGKYSVTLVFLGGPNMFGGRLAPKVYRKLQTADEIVKHMDSADLFKDESGDFTHQWQCRYDKLGETA
ncbi:MAG: hypothetical protein E4H01_06005 [Lysobacterales bacterium]|nr:MAG: hypothetical protein E4H01_06005 [Xanthomonadales bacterium]